jgi:hypothetical protein
LRDANGFRRFKLTLEKLGIPHTDFLGNLDESVDKILAELFDI